MYERRREDFSVMAMTIEKKIYKQKTWLINHK